MKYYFLTLFPEQILPYFDSSMMKRAVDAGIIDYEVINIRDFTKNKHKRVDDYPYGGGAGLVMGVQPLADALRSIDDYQNKTVIHLSPSGTPYCQAHAQELAEDEKDLIFVCGHYEGIDQRFLDRFVDLEFSAGDYVLTGGELPALIMADSIARNVPGFLGNVESLTEESFSQGLLEYPLYTRPEEFEGMRVPDVLLSGHHKKIQQWRQEKALEKTRAVREDLINQSNELNLTKKLDK